MNVLASTQAKRVCLDLFRLVLLADFPHSEMFVTTTSFAWHLKINNRVVPIEL